MFNTIELCVWIYVNGRMDGSLTFIYYMGLKHFLIRTKKTIKKVKHFLIIHASKHISCDDHQFLVWKLQNVALLYPLCTKCIIKRWRKTTLQLLRFHIKISTKFFTVNSTQKSFFLWEMIGIITKSKKKHINYYNCLLPEAI